MPRQFQVIFPRSALFLDRPAPADAGVVDCVPVRIRWQATGIFSLSQKLVAQTVGIIRITATPSAAQQFCGQPRRSHVQSDQRIQISPFPRGLFHLSQGRTALGILVHYHAGTGFSRLSILRKGLGRFWKITALLQGPPVG